MRERLIGLIALIALGVTAYGQSSAKVFSIPTVQTQQDLNDIATIARSVLGISQVTSNLEQKSLAMSGTADQLAAMDWLSARLAEPPGTGGSAQSQFRIAGASNDVVKVFRLDTNAALRHLGDLSTVLRTIALVQRVIPYSRANQIVMRGTEAEVAMSEWIVAEIGQPVPNPPREPHEYWVSGANNLDVVSVFYLPDSPVRRLNDTATAIRRSARVQRLIPLIAPASIVLRGTPDQLVEARHLLPNGAR